MTLREASSILASAGIENAKNDVLLLYGTVSGRSLASLMFSLDEDISGEICYKSFAELLQRRAAREPLQYILGKWGFYGDDYKVSPACLIPRPETEDIVTEVLSRIPKSARIADLCCGSGCIGIAILRNSDAVCDSVDISEDALAIADENARSLGVSDRIRFSLADITQDGALSGEYDVIVSNPPYIRRKALAELDPELSYEPKIALDGGEDGMTFYRAIVENYAFNLKTDGIFVFEIGFDQANDIVSLAEEHGLHATVKLDMEKRPRAAILRRK